jgi:putative drug exporter of the RND superfamily
MAAKPVPPTDDSVTAAEQHGRVAQSMPSRAVAAVIKLRVLIVIAWVIVLVAAFALLPALGSQVNSDLQAFLPSSSPSVQAASLAGPVSGTTSHTKITVVAWRPNAALTAADMQSVSRESTRAAALPGVLKASAGTVSPDRQAIEIDVTVSGPTRDQALIKSVVTSLEDSFGKAAPPSGLQFHLFGDAASNVANNASSNKDSSLIGQLSIVFIIVLLLILLRSPVAAIAALLPSIVALLITQRLVAELGTHGLDVSPITQTLLIVLILGAGTDYGLFLIYRFRENLRHGAEPHEAVAGALGRVGLSVIASATTVVLALLTLLFASFGLYRDLAVPLAIGIAVALLAGLTLLPALLSLFGSLVFPSIPDGGEPPEVRHRETVWHRIAAFTVRYPARILGVGVLVLTALALCTLGYHSAAVGRTVTAPPGSNEATGNAIVSAHFPAAVADPSDLVFRYAQPAWEQPQALATAQSSLGSSGLFSTLSGPLDPNGTALTPQLFAQLHSMLGDPRGLPVAEPGNVPVARPVYDAYRDTAQYVSADGTLVRFQAQLKAGSQASTAAMDVTPQVRATVTTAATRSGATASGVTGRAAAFYDVTQGANSDIKTIIPIAVLAIALLLGIVLRSLTAPLYLVVSIVLSYFAALGGATLLIIDLGGQQGLIFVLPFLMFVFLLALGEDYNILVMTRIREESARLPTREAIVEAAAKTGPTITSAGILLAGTFGVMAIFGGNVLGGQLRSIGIGLALGILLDTFVVRALLVPTTAALLGRWNWWPSGMSKRRPLPEPGTPLPVNAGE